MVVYSDKAQIVFPRYGIQIPSLDSRRLNTLRSLQEDPLLGPRQGEWLVEGFPLSITPQDLKRVHKKEYIDRILRGEEEPILTAYELIDQGGRYNRYDPTLAQAPLGEILQDVLVVTAGTYHTIGLAIQRGFVYFLGGGMHHAHPGMGHGFCLLNDIGIALAKARSEGLIQRVWVVDIDAHRGDGTAEIFAQTREVKTVSIHMAAGWPLDGPPCQADGRPTPGWFPGDLDIPIASGEEEQYLPRLLEALEKLEKGGLPDLALVVAGVDPYEGDALPSTAPLRMTREQMFQRDQEVYRFFQDRGVPSAWLAAGGYGEEAWEIHSQFLRWVLPLGLP